LVDVGEYVNADDVVARIETDKVTVDILSTHSGVITKYFAEEGDTVEVGAQFLEIDTEAKGSATPAAAPKKEEAPAKVSCPSPSLNLIN
jgi:2-oxoglutarate dehydrogenase E2 component (dihydrolipoamide succinyltransferase)